MHTHSARRVTATELLFFFFRFLIGKVHDEEVSCKQFCLDRTPIGQPPIAQAWSCALCVLAPYVSICSNQSLPASRTVHAKALSLLTQSTDLVFVDQRGLGPAPSVQIRECVPQSHRATRSLCGRARVLAAARPTCEQSRLSHAPFVKLTLLLPRTCAVIVHKGCH